MATTIPQKLKKSQVNGSEVVDFDTDTLKCALFTVGAGAPAVTNSGVQYLDDITADDATCVEVTGTGYSRQTLVPTVADDGTTGVKWTFTDVTFSQNAAGFTDARYAVFFKDAGGADSANPIVAIADLSSDRSVVSGDLILQCPAGGLIAWS